MDKHTVHLGIGVANGYEGQGLGKRLMQKLFTEAKHRGKKNIELIYIYDNVRAQRLYKRFGFRQTGKNIGSDGLHYCQMRAELAK